MTRYVGRHRRPSKPCQDRRGVLANVPCLLDDGHCGGHVIPFGNRTLRLGTGGVFKGRP